MATNENTAPGEKTYLVWADSRVFQQVDAASPQAAYEEAKRYPGDFEPCNPGITNMLLLPEVMDLDSGEHFRVGPTEPEPEQGTLRRASQRLYDAINQFLTGFDLSDCDMKDLEMAMDDMEAAWRKADGTVPEQDHEHAS